ncbi:SusD/RagB family nutrient-binding outer membrane lipoprotein [Flavobacteriaceae bacterium F89]|uniref:SusD/RagB family nutrient-binding outer membrane lipoprotein n=1 Tax=Cerina litoralis TaxID=2874477 RepID=A0AAE3JTT8_9FLAO|nr:SusD/RagB family nutrient-binding outer membrane lipoprotein [Cerina litoralis]MCG2461792.1 SusD/RagB family nutrient-binding outer membrane lipoprotein [Cerina litoralis]
MKYIQNTIQKISIALVVGILLLSCQNNLDDLRENPNAVTEIDDAALFTKAVRSLFLGTTDVSALRFSGHYGHYFVAGSTARIPDQYGDNFDSQYNDMYTDMYGGPIRHIEDVLEITTADGTKNEVRHAMADVIAVLAYAKITDAFGDIPYTEGGKGKTEDILLPKYDTQESIYKDMIGRLGNSIAVLKSADPAMGYPNSDPVFNNDLDKWVKFANSVRLRLGMRIRFADNALSKEIVAQCLAAPLMEGNGDDAFMIQTEGNGNPWYNARTGFPSVKMSTFLLDQLESTADPRLPKFFMLDQAGQYSGETNGLNDVAFGESNFAAKSDMGLALSSQDSKMYMITASEVWLLRAEAALIFQNDPAKANELYRKGIERSLHQWEIDGTEISNFMASPITTLAGANDEEQIGTQLWLALIPNYFEGWTQIRRTGYPIIKERTYDNLSRGVTNGNLPTRFLYSSFELSSNHINVEEAISRQGANKIDTPVWWDKN